MYDMLSYSLVPMLPLIFGRPTNDLIHKINQLGSLAKPRSTDLRALSMISACLTVYSDDLYLPTLKYPEALAQRYR